MDQDPPGEADENEALRRAVEALAADVEWRAPEGDDFFDMILTGTRGVDRIRVSVRAYAEAGPDEFRTIMEYADQLVAAETHGLHRENHVFLILTSALKGPPVVRSHVEAFNQSHWSEIQGRHTRCFIAYAPIHEAHPIAPGAVDPLPDLTGVDLRAVLGTEATTPPRMHSKPPPSHCGIDVLVVDDDPVVREVIGDLLREDDLVVEAAEAWDQVRLTAFGGPVAVILLDVNMPGMTGDKVAKLVRFARPPKPQVILYSSLEEAQLAPMAEAVGARGWLRKGGPEQEVVRVVREALSAFRGRG